jgi:F0F1-type ATP synthase delta subunit
MKDALPGESGLVKVITPTQPTNAYKEQLESKLQESYPKKLEILYEEDPSLIAGGILQFETELIDGSLQGQIEQLKQKYEQKV